VKGFTKKGKMFLQFETNLAESIQEQLTIHHSCGTTGKIKINQSNATRKCDFVCVPSCIERVSCASYRACTSQGATSWCVETTSTIIIMTASRSITITISASRSKTIIVNADRFITNTMTEVGLQPLT
jgi:hypothetical protein